MINITKKKLFELEFYGGAKRGAEEISGIMKELVYDDEPNSKTLKEWQKKIKSSEIEDIQTSINNLQTSITANTPQIWEMGLRSRIVSGNIKTRLDQVPKTVIKDGERGLSISDGSPYRPKDDIQDWLDDEDLTYENSKKIEIWCAKILKCQYCQNKPELNIYANNSMPTYDLVCIICNSKYQVKSQSTSRKKKYFNVTEDVAKGQETTKNSNFIITGSRTWGDYPHSISSDDADVNNLKVNYFLVEYKKSDESIFITKVYYISGSNNTYKYYDKNIEGIAHFGLKKPIILFDKADVIFTGSISHENSNLNSILSSVGGAIKYKIHYSENQ